MRILQPHGAVQTLLEHLEDCAGGEIDALDPGGFGALRSPKAITIDGGGNLASSWSAALMGLW